jgi:hypothetical protein
MYHIFYFGYTPRLLCTFKTYPEAHKTLTYLNKRYPDSQIWIQPATVIESHDEFMLRFNGVIENYEQQSDVEKVDVIK